MKPAALAAAVRPSSLPFSPLITIVSMFDWDSQFPRQGWAMLTLLVASVEDLWAWACHLLQSPFLPLACHPP